jgi:hypothetical protein
MSNLPESLPLGASVPFSPAFLHAINFVLPHEEEFARGHWGDENYVIAEHDPHDPGGAIAIYYQEWRFYHIFLLPERIAIAQFDVRVNGGHAVAWLQRAINAVGHLSLKVDGVLGPATINAANTVNETPVLRYFINERDQRFAALAADNANFASFLKGWLQRDRDLRAYLCV